ncbi:FOG: WD40 repeat [Plasmopara halstedii]|uniref:FOG: WD40 repeat n=1 Tax=Plasmopara halstedii TaxID=4781 RepID=A0A0P1B3K6_PLAHL|nr:FOG: WD40 repeat [Plasmopara halstedii]CEG48132.1 FOG: WD40 repeat [Plasmopara halstedii]|eukprot:XP_024584501.1 FOG: WD40 repeat [Plasmopara halstedii]
MGCLEPTKPERRRRCLPLSTRCLHTLVRRFPMVDFHQETQRLALGTMEAVIVIYDLRTATKWRVLDGHGSAVSAVRFRFDGQVLVSYAARDGSVRWWNSGNAGLFGGMLKMYQSCLKEHKLSTLQENSTGGASSSTGGTSAGLKQIIQTCRFQFLTRKDSSENKCTSNSERPKHVLRLTREDASQVQFLL